MAALHKEKVDRVFLGITATLVIIGFVIFASASLGLHARTGADASSVAFNQGFLGLFLGSVGLLVASRIPYRFWYTHAFIWFILACIVTLLVFVPGIGVEFGGARRWLLLGGVSFQPAELLKLAFVLYFSATLFKVRDDLTSFRDAVLPLAIIIGIACGALILQPNTSNAAVIFLTGIAMFLAAGGRFRYLFAALGIGIAMFATLMYTKPYIYERVMTFLHPSADALGSSYQIQQSLIAIGSGGVFGRGFGQSIQKFGILPEPIGDSIFAVAAEEFGFVGSVFLVLLFLLFAYCGLRIATHSPDPFGGLVATGIVILILSQSLLNMSAMLGIVPLTGTGLLFVSHGGTALFFTLFEIGIMLNISSYRGTMRLKQA